ncbi:MAG: ADOP family duplicated permease, partial [Candidatus Sulfotelmatobacter sp.]
RDRAVGPDFTGYSAGARSVLTELAMRLFSLVKSLFRCLFRRQQIDAELDEEIRSTVELLADQKIKDGMPPNEARRAARIELGGVEQVKEEVRAVRVGAWLDTLLQDLRFGLRMLRKNPGFTTVTVLTLALGIGANTAIFSVVNAVLLRPLPYRNPDRIVWATERFPFNRNSAVVITPDFIGWKQGNDVFAEIGAFLKGSPGGNLTGEGEPQRVSVTTITTNFFQMLGIRPVIGRAFLPEEGKQSESHVALLNETLWRNRFDTDRHIVGKTIDLDGTAYTVVGIMPGSVRYPRSDVWIPLALDSEVFSPHSLQWMALTVIGRLKPGISVDEARANLQVLIRRMDQQYPPQAATFRANARADVVPLHGVLVQNVRVLLLILLGAVGLVLLIACANIANLLLSRTAARAKEIAVRVALGAGRWRLAQQILTESLLLGVFGGLGGLAAGFLGTTLLRQLIPPELPADIRLEWRTFGFAAALAILATVLFGLVPALIASFCDANESLKNGPVVNRYRASRVRSVLVVGEIGVSLVLLCGAGLLARTLLRLSDVHLGFDPNHLLLATVERPFTLEDSQQQAAFFQQALDLIRDLPGVQRAAAAEQYPLGGIHDLANQIRLADGTICRPGTPILMDGISPGYFRTLGAPLLKGRSFNDGDSAGARRVAILSESLARQAFKGHDPLGQHFGIITGEPEFTVVGVVADARNSALDQEPLSEIFTPYLQKPSFRMTFVVRTEGNPHSLASGVRSVVLSVDKNQPLAELRTMDEILATEVAPRRFRTLLVGLFALLALALAVVGVYGVTTFSVSQRTHEIGIRIAVGAQRRDVLKLVLVQAALLTMGGVAIGVCAALWLTRYSSTLLFGVKPTDPITFACASILIVVVSLIAAYIPARRAMNVDPMVALRYE